MQLKEVMTRNVRYIDSNTSILQASQKMRDLNVGSLPICENGKILGMVTDRDIAVRAVAGRKKLDTPVTRVMTAHVICCNEDEGVESAMRMMEQNGVRRIVVCNGEGEMVGIITLDDLARRPGVETLASQTLQKIVEQDQAPNLH